LGGKAQKTAFFGMIGTVFHGSNIGWQAIGEAGF
jgi:hypothetical protein